MSNPIMDSIGQLDKIQDVKKANLTQLHGNIGAFKDFKGKDPFILMAIFMTEIMSGDNGKLFGRSTFGENSKGNIISTQEDKVREVAGQKNVTNAFTSVLSKAQMAFNSSGGTITELETQLAQVKAGLERLAPGGNPIPGSPFDKASVSSMNSAIDTLTANIAEVRKTYGDGKDGFSKLFEAAKEPSNVGASSLIKSFNDQFSTVGTTTQTMSNATSTNMQMVNADYQQFLGILNSLLQAFHKQTQAHVQNLPKG